MQIGIDATCWSNKRGYGRFTRDLLKALVAVDQDNDILFFVDKDTASLNDFPAGVKIVVAPTSVAPTEAASASGRRSIRDLWAMSRQVMKHDLDLFFFPAVYSYFPILNRTKIVVTIHDMIADHHPDKIFPNKKLMFFWKLKQNLAVRQADLILTVSEYSKRQIIDYFKFPESFIETISEAANPNFGVLPQNGKMAQVLNRFQLNHRERFLLYVGGISPHKNLKVLVDAYDQLIKDLAFSDVKLVLVGDYKSDSFYSAYASLKSHIEQLCLDERVIFTGFISDEVLAYLYNAASLLVLPSLEEGFGLPAIEAMACGTPVVSSNKGSLPEILGQAGHFFDPFRPESICNILQDVLSNDTVRNEMRRFGLLRSKQFTWQAVARKTLSIFDSLVDKKANHE
jgi:glycosyltransferase involved in cell wall biosynthesis